MEATDWMFSEVVIVYTNRGWSLVNHLARHSYKSLSRYFFTTAELVCNTWDYLGLSFGRAITTKNSWWRDNGMSGLLVIDDNEKVTT